MNATQRTAGLAGMLLFAALPAAAQDASITLQPVKYAGLAEAVARHRGKVVLVDLWAHFCQPCKQGFPRLVQLHERHAREGLAVISVCLDPPPDRGKAEQFLVANRATFTNLWLDEAPEIWTKRLHTESIPCLYLFDRRGRWFQFPDGDHAELEKRIVQLLAE
jgi:thiol-disulfide isomerase/thioredoxin